ncbi:MAG: AAA family ATPase [Candidatus Moranbacteria bacterium RIFCSPHIGHO2_01_FULL_55_24]|nr:MAG: AAA family ATPase [Candidatus Moranbacteria bacterium RIFCSPHIGHO2_01_FULL_55_24]
MKNKNTSSTTVPLAERLRPKALEEFLGQEKIFGEGSFLREALAADQVPSLIFWGPPGSGKTTLALLIAERTAADFFQLSAVGSGVKELRRIIETAEENRKIGKRTILFIDEIHRWNKAQQDALLPHVERGTLTLIGATTENPSFEVNGALLSRTRVLVLDKHGSEALVRLMERALAEAEKYFGKKVAASKEALEFIASVSGGDARQALGTLEACALHAGKEGHIDPKLVEQVVKRSHILYDKGGEEHYNIISALHKSMRGGDANAALYWLARMLEGGEDPLYVARRLVRFASEDVGLANSFALPQAVAAFQACQFLGMPECEVHLAQAVVYLASSKKSNALYVGYNQAKEDVRKYPNEPVPLHIRNAPTKLMKEIGYGKDYKYTPDYESEEEAAQEYFPEKLKGRKYINLETHQ